MSSKPFVFSLWLVLGTWACAKVGNWSLEIVHRIVHV